MCLAFPGQVVAIDAAGAVVDVDGERRRAATFLLPDVAIGDWVTVAAGSILGRIDAAEAAELVGLLRIAIRGVTTDPETPSTASPERKPA